MAESDRDWEIVYNELERQVDHQISENERYQRQAALFLRIIIATFGLALTALSLGTPSQLLKRLYTQLSPSKIPSVSTELVKEAQFQESGADLIVTFLLLLVVAAHLLTIYYWFVIIPANAYQVAYPKQFKPSLSTFDASMLYDDRTDTESKVISRYRDIVSENQEIVEDTQRQLAKCFDGARRGIMYALTAAIGMVALLVPNKWLVSPALAILLGAVIQFILNRFSFREHSQFARPRLETITPILLMLLAFYLESDLLLLLAVISGFIVPLLTVFYLGGTSRLKVAATQLALILLVSGIYGIMNSLINPEINPYASDLGLIFLLLFISSGSALTGTGSLYIILATIQEMEEFAEEYLRPQLEKHPLYNRISEIFK